ncbi:MAG: iron ABC transporter permease [Burkholderiaceae bacterium]|nr:iron ABC transporter permease [Burkholderiaceae bacterium]
MSGDAAVARAPTGAQIDSGTRRRRQLVLALALAAVMLVLFGLAIGSEGISWSSFMADVRGDQAALIFGQIRAPRTIGAFAVGALLGLAGAVAQGLFRNPLADPYLLGSASGATLAVVLVLAASELTGNVLSAGAAQILMRIGLVIAAFVGALVGVLLTLAISQGARHTLRLLLGGVVVGVVLGALSDLVTSFAPEALRSKQMFMLGSTGYLSWSSVFVLAAGLVFLVPLALRFARFLDAMTLGEDTAASLGLQPSRARIWLVLLLALGTGIAVSQAGLVAFVGLVSPHLVRRFAPSASGYTVAVSAVAGGVLLMAADVVARALIAPQELPVGIVTAVLGGGYLMWLLYRRSLLS